MCNGCVLRLRTHRLTAGITACTDWSLKFIDQIICREAGREEVIYALDGLEEKVFIAKYKVKLPSEAKIKKAIRDL